MAVNRTKVLEAAQKFLSKGQYDKAIAEYQKLVNEDPRDVRTLLKIGDLHTRRNKPKDAIDVYQKVAELYAKQGFFLKAVAVYKQILKLDPQHIDSSQKLAKMYEELALTSDALSTYEQVADAYMAQGQTQKALETMQRMVELDGQNVAARIKYAEALSKADKPKEAAKAFAEGAHLLKEQGRMDDYIRVVERQLYHDPDNLDIARELSSMYLERSDPKRALAKLQVCFKADPRDVQTLEMLAEAFRQLGQVPKTVSVLKEIARLHGEMNAIEPKRRTLKRILDLDPNDAEAKQLMAGLGGAPAPTNAQRTGAAAPAPAPAAPRPTMGGAAQAKPQPQPAARADSDFPPVPEPDEIEMELEASSDDLLDAGDSRAKPAPAPAPQARSAPAPAAPRATAADVHRAPTAPVRSAMGDPRMTMGDAQRAPAQMTRSTVGGEPPRAPDVPSRSQARPEPKPEAPRDRMAALLAQAETAEAANRYDQAEKALQQVLAIDPNHLPSHERLKDLYLATERRVDAVRELLWLSEAWGERSVDRAVQYAKAAYDLAPHAAVTKNRLMALGIDPDREKQEEVMFVEDSRATALDQSEDTGEAMIDAILPHVQDPAPRSAATLVGAQPEPRRPTFGDRGGAIEDPLDIPLSPDDFDAPPPVRRASAVSAAQLQDLLEHPITPEEFDREAEAEPEPMAARAPAQVADEDEDMAALLDAPIDDDFGAPPPKRSLAAMQEDVDDLLDKPLPPDDFGLSDERFDRSGLIDVDDAPAISTRAASTVPPSRRTAAVQVAEDDSPSIEFTEIGTSEIDVGDDDELRGDGALADEGAPLTLPPPKNAPAGAAAFADPPISRSTGEFVEIGTGEIMQPEELKRPVAPLPPPPFKVPPADPFAGLPRPGAAVAKAPEIAAPKAPVRDESDFSDLEDHSGADATVRGEPIPELVRQSRGALEPVGKIEPPPSFEESTATEHFEEEELLFVEPEAEAEAAPAAEEVEPAFEEPSEPEAEAPAAVASAAPVEDEGDEELPPEVEEAMDEADFFASQGLMDEALEAIQEAILIYPQIRALKAKLAEYEAKADEHEAAEEARASDKEDDSFDIAKQLASELDLGEAPEAAAHPDEMVDVESVFAQFKKGVAAQISVDDSETHFDLGIAYKEMGLTDDAMSEFEIAARSPQRACTALTMIGMCCLEKGDAKKAVEQFERALSSPVKSPAEELALQYEIGNANDLLGQLDKAIAAFEKVAARDRTFRGVMARLEQLKQRRGKTATALG